MARDMIRDCLLLHQVEHSVAVEHLKVLVLVQVLDVAADSVELTQKIVVARANKQLSAALELLLAATRFRQDQTGNIGAGGPWGPWPCARQRRPSTP